MTISLCSTGTTRALSDPRSPVPTVAASVNTSPPRSGRGGAPTAPRSATDLRICEPPSTDRRSLRMRTSPLSRAAILVGLSKWEPWARSRAVRLVALAAVLSAVTLVAAACEDKAIGRPCDVQSDAGAMQAVFNGQALECPSRICIKPSREQSVAVTDTAPYCTAECSKDSDCDGERRDTGNPRDRRCKSGFVCG